MKFKSKLPSSPTTIFSKMSALAREYGAINLGQGFPNFEIDPELKVCLTRASEAGHHQYAPMPGLPALREVIAAKYNAAYDLNLDADRHITITAGATQALFSTITAMVHPGDEVIIFEPAYDSYAPSIRINGGIVKPYLQTAPDYKIDWDRVGEMISERTRMIIINNPQNPIGKIMEEDDLKALEQLVLDTDIVVLSDEVYEHLVYDGKSHQCILSFKSLRDRVVACYSFGKTFHVTGWKIGYTIAGAALTNEIRKMHQWNVFSVHTPSQYALAEYMTDSRRYDGLADFYQKKRDLFAQLMKDSSFEPLTCEGTYFQLYDYSAISDMDDVAFAENLVRDVGVAVIPISVFTSDGRQDRVVRFCFAKTDSMLIEAGSKLSRL